MTNTSKKAKRKQERRRRAAERARNEKRPPDTAATTAEASPAASDALPSVLPAVVGSRKPAPDPDPSVLSCEALQSFSEVDATPAANLSARNAATCMVLQADAAAAVATAPITELLHVALLRLLYSPHRVVQSLQAFLHVLDNRYGNFSESDLRDAPTFPLLRKLIRSHPMHHRGTMIDTPLESCKLATTMLLILCAQINGEGTRHLMESAGWLSQSRGAFASSYLKRPNAKEKTFRSAVVAAAKTMQLWTQESSTGVTQRRGICLGVGVVDCAVFRQPWLSGCAHHFALVLAPVATSESDCDSKGKQSFVGRLYQAYGPPDIGYSLRQNVYVGGGSHNMSENEVWQYVDAFEKMHECTSWGQAKPHYVRVFGAEPRLSSSYPFEIHVYTRTSEFSEESLGCMCRVHAALLDVPYAVLP
jgi:hypothetical protein